MNSSPWRLEEVDGEDEQYPVESRFVLCHTSPNEQTPVSTVALKHKSISSVLRYATPLPINRTPFRPSRCCNAGASERSCPLWPGMNAALTVSGGKHA